MKKWRKSLLALVLVVAMLCPSVSPAVHAEELDDVTVTTEAATAEESITEEETTEEETTVEETTVEETNGEITTEVTEETSEEVFTEEETTSVPSMQAPLMAAPLPIAPLAEAAPDNVLNADHRPVGSTVFFDADNEKPSFNVVSYYDTYTEKLGNKVVNSQYNWNSALSIKSSTDGALYHDLILNKDVLSIDYETGHPVEYTAYNGGKKQSSDGTYTIVGWGGDFQSGASKDRLKITFAGVSESLSELRDMKIQLYNKDGSLGQKITIDKLKENGATKLNDYETAYEVALDSSTEYQGIKFLFENTSGQEDMAGTILVSNVEMRCNGNWVDFAPFDFNTDKWNYYHVQWEDGSPSILPFLRATENAGRSWFYDESRTGTTAGYNISKTDTWHLWTMSTSDANIVDGTVNDAANRQALQIKYRDDYGTGVGGGHRTHVIMSSTQPVAGEYLAITMKTIGDLGEASLQLRNNNGTEFVTSARFALDFRKSLNSYDAATNVCNNPEYQTLYLPLNGKAFDTVEFNFTACHTRGRMFITEIYVVNPGVELEKTVKVNDGSATKELVNAKLGDILTYAIDVKNSGVLQVNKAVVTDVLPAGVTFKEAMNGGIYDEATNSVTWEVTDLAAGETKKVEFIVTVNDDFLGLIKNVAKTLTVNDKEFNTTSNEVYVEVRGVNTQKEYVFYNEVDKLNTLPIHLGATEIEIKEKQPGESLAVTKNIEIKEVDGGGYENYPKKEFELNFGTEKAGKHDITMFTTENGNFILKEVVINNKTYTTNKQNIRDKINGIFSNYEGVDDNGFGFVDSTERLSGLGNGKFITFKDVDIPADGTVKFQFYIRTYKEKIFPMTVDYNMVGPEKEVVIGTVWAPDQLLADQPEIGNGNNAVSIDANGNVKYRYTGDEAPFTDTFYVHYKSATGVDNNEDKNPVYPDDGYKTVKVIVHNYKAKDYVYVLDYGLPVSLTGNGTNLAADIDEYAELHLQNGDGAYFTGFRTEKRGGAEVVTDDYVTEYGELESMKTTNGTVSTTWADPNAEELTATYTPQRFMDCADIFYYGVQVTASNAHPTYYVSNATPVMEGKIKVVPANVVYYEDNFAHSKKDDVDGDNGIIYEGSVTFVEGDSRFQNNSFDVQYGYDATYAEDDEYSGDNVAELPKGTCATFQFKGTGFDILSRTNNNTGDIMVAVYDVDKDHAKVVRDPETRKTKVINAETDDVAKYISLRSVNTYYENGDLYQVPVISEDLGKYGNYIVRVVATGKVGTSIYLDGIRIYNPAGVGENADDNVVSEYLPEEQNAEFIEVRSMILGKGYQFNFKNPIESIPGESPCATLVQWPGDNNGLFLNGMTVVENFTGDYEHPSNITGNTNHLLTYATQGPNNELYLENGYAIAFNVTPDDNEADNTLQIGVKQVTGEPNLVYLSQNGDWQSLIPNGDPVKSATELYYKIPVNDCFEGVVVLGVQNDGVISFTNVKNSGYEMYALTDEQMKELAWTTPDGGLIAESTLSVLASLKNKNLMVTFAASNQVTGVVVTDENENEVTITTASYIFSDANNNTWTVCFAAEKNTKYTLTAFTEAGTYEILSELEY